MEKNENVQSYPTQDIVSVVDIRDNIVITNKGEFRTVLKLSGINFDLYDLRERQQIIFAFQTFLNSLEFPIQILVQSRYVNLDSYLQKLKMQAAIQPTEDLKIETYEYINFIEELTRVGTIMDKFFYVIVGYSPVPLKPMSIFQKLLLAFQSKPKSIRISNFEEIKRKLFERTRVVAQGLSGMGLGVVQLTNPELVELFFTSYNPGAVIKSGDIAEELKHLWTTSRGS